MLETNAWELLGQNSSFQSMARGMRSRSSGMDSTDVLIGVAILVGVALGAALLYVLVNRGDQTRRCNNPKKLFRSLCNAHQLDRTCCKVLRQMAAHQRLSQPARLFLEPERFDAANLSSALQSHDEQINELRAKLFASDTA